MFGFTAVVTILALASAAFACTEFRGTMTVQGDVSTSTVTVIGNGTSMNYCSRSGKAYAYKDFGDVKITVSPASSSCGGHKLPGPYTYTATFLQDAYYNGTRYYDCMAVGGDTGTVKIKDDNGSSGFPVDANGNGGPKWFNLPNGLLSGYGTPYEAGVCVSDTTYSPSLYGNQAPVVIY